MPASYSPANVKAAPASLACVCVASGWPLVQVESWLRVSCGSAHPSQAQLSTGDPGGFSADEVGVGSMAAQLCPPEHRPRAGKGIGGPPTFSPVLTSTLGLASELIRKGRRRIRGSNAAWAGGGGLSSLPGVCALLSAWSGYLLCTVLSWLCN